MKNLNLNTSTKILSIAVGHGYTFAYNYETFIHYIHKANGDVVSSFAWHRGLTCSEFAEEVRCAEEYANEVHHYVSGINNAIKTIGGQQ